MASDDWHNLYYDAFIITRLLIHLLFHSF